MIQQRQGFRKVVNFCRISKESGLKYGWVDTCCIDKRSSAELSESINSMYRYYAESDVCFIYLADVRASDGEEGVRVRMEKSKWFTRGWTLQELIAPSRRRVYDTDWTRIMGDRSKEGLHTALATAAGIPRGVLDDSNPISSFCVAERMRWVSERLTTREEDMAYCLMGLFDVHMPIIYGEGVRKAFRRLQMEIMQTSFDQSLFAWRAEDYEESGLLARHPSDFSRMPYLSLWGPRYLSPYTMTNVGLSVRLVDVTPRKEKKASSPETTLTAIIQCNIKNLGTREWDSVAIFLRPIEDAAFQVNGAERKAYRRIRCDEIHRVSSAVAEGSPFCDILVLEDEHHSLILNSIRGDKSGEKATLTRADLARPLPLLRVRRSPEALEQGPVP